MIKAGLSSLLLSVFLSVPATAQDLNAISKVEISGDAQKSTVVVVGSRRPTFQAYLQKAPVRVVVDLVKSQLQNVPNTVMPSTGNGLVKEIRATQMGTSGRELARLEIVFNDEVDYQMDADGNSLRLTATRRGKSQEQLLAEKKAAEEKAAKEKAEKEAAEKAAELARLEKERLEKEKAEKEAAAKAAELARLEKEKAEKEAAAAKAAELARLEKERLEKEKAEKEAAAKAAELARLEKEKAEKEALAKAAAEKAAREAAELARIEKEKAEKEAAAKAAELARLEKEAAAKAAAERARQEKLASEKEKAELARAEKERQEREKAEQARAERERQEREKAELARAEKDRQEQERLERMRADVARAEATRAEKEAARSNREATSGSAADAPTARDSEEGFGGNSTVAAHAAPDGSREDDSEPSGGPRVLTSLGFKNIGEQSVIVARTNDKVAYNVRKVGENRIVIELENTRILLRNNQRVLDTSYFPRTAIKLINPEEHEGAGKTVKILIELSEDVPYEAKQDNNTVTVAFQRPAG